MNLNEILNSKEYELVIRPVHKVVPKENVHITTIPFHLRGDIQILEKSNNERIIAGYASVIEVDQEEQLIPEETLKSGIETLLKDSEYANLMLVHQNMQIGQILSEWGDLKTHVDEKGLFIVAKIRQDLNTANEVWDMILNHEMNGFSIAAEVLLDHDECDESKCITVIDKINIFEISVCSKPVNVKSGFVIISKANMIKEDDNMDKENVDVCKDCSKEGITKMVKEEILEESEETNTETVEESTEESPTIENTIESLSREVEALKGVIEELKGKSETPEEEMPEEEPKITENAEPDEEKPEPIEEKPEPIEEKAEGKPDYIDEPDEETEDEEEDIEEEDKAIKAEEKPVDVPSPSQKDFDDLKNSVDELLSKFSKLEDIGKLKLAIESKDEKIVSLNKRLEVIEKSEADKKVVVEKEDEDETEERLELIKDPVRTGVLYRDM